MSKEAAFRTHYVKNLGLWEDSPVTELQGTPKIIAEAIRDRLDKSCGDEPVIVIDLGAMLGIHTIAVAKEFEDDIKAGRLQVILTDKESFNPREGITDGLNTKLSQEINFAKMLPGSTMLEYVEENEHLVTRISGVETENLPKVLEQNHLKGVDVLVEHFGGFFHADDKPKAAETVRQVLKSGGVVVTSEFLEDENKFGRITHSGLKPQGEHTWGQLSKTYKKLE